MQQTETFVAMLRRQDLTVPKRLDICAGKGMAKRKAVSIYTIGRELGLSPGTVSRALRDHPSISAETRAAVKPLAEKYHFRPRYVSTKPINICLLIQKVEGHPLGFDDHIALFMEGMAEYCQEEMLEMSIYGNSAEEMNRCDIVRELRRRQVDGAIVLRSTDESDYIKQFDKFKFPYMCLANHPDHKTPNKYGLNSEKMAHLATEYLLSQGHRRIGFICDSMHIESIRDRYEGYIHAHKDLNLPTDPNLLYSSDPVSSVFKSTMQIGAAGAEALLARVPDLSAIFAADDKIAYGAMSYLQGRGIAIPKQISVIGLSDYPTSAYVYPPLTTIHVPYKEIGFELARQVHRLCKGMGLLFKDSSASVSQAQVIVRQSVAAVSVK